MASERDLFVGRRREVGVIGDVLGDPALAGVVLVGESGVGKTALARYALETAQAAGFSTATVRATRAASSIPFGALEPIVGDELGEGSVGVLRSARERILEIAGGSPLVLLVDDAQLLDDMSATLVLQLAGEENVFVLATVRSGTEVPDPVTALWKDAGARRVDITPLDLAGIDELLQALLGAPLAVAALARLVELSQGLPLAIRELVDAARLTGALRLRDGIWGLEGDLTLSDRLVDLIELRLMGCSQEEKDALVSVALGDPLPLVVADGITSRAVLQSLEEKHLIRLRPSTDDITVAHPLYGEVALQDLGELRRRSLLTALADRTLEREKSSPNTDLRIAIWRLASASGGEIDTRVLLRGAEAAYRAADHPTTVELASAAWERSRTAEAGHLLGLALGRLTRAAEAEDVLAEAEAILDQSPNDARMRVLVALARSENLFRGLNDAAAALACVESAEANLEDREWRDELVAHRAMLVLNAGGVRTALELTEPLITEGTPDRPFVKAAYAAGIALAYAGQSARAGELARKALPVHERVWAEDLFQTEPAVHHVTAILALAEDGQLLTAESYADLAVQLAAQSGESYGLAYMSMLAALVALRRGKVLTARRRSLDAVPLFRAAGYPSPLRWVLAGAAIADALSGELDSARRHLDTADELAASTPARLNEAIIYEARAWLQIGAGDSEAARESLRAGAQDALDRGELSSAAHLLHCLGRSGEHAEAKDRLTQLSSQVHGDLQDLRVAHLAALTAGDGPGLDVVAGRFATSGADLLAAEAAASAVRAHRRRGDQRAATRSALTAAECATRCEGARTPAMTITGTVEPLTDREREIALLAAGGLPSKQIAERLTVSRRTVDNHLQRVFGKLGISSRADLPDALGIS